MSERETNTARTSVAPSTPQPGGTMPSLLDDDAGDATTGPQSRNAARNAGLGLRERINRAGRRPFASPRARRITAAVLAFVLVGGSAGAYFALRPTPQPDYLTGALDDLFDYTLLTSEFNNLPVEERLALIRQLVDRLRAMQGGESSMLAAFAAGIAGAAREQLEENVSRLAVDSFDLLAADYDTRMPPADREAYAAQSFVEIQKFFEEIAGFDRDLTDEERLERGREQAQRDLDRIREGEFSSTEAGRLFEFMNEGIGQHASPHQRARATVLMRDMIRVMRGQDVASGETKRP